ncbi:MAG: dTDP-4-dehydrorhamnose reductase [Chlorobiaceae bacterium]
MNILVTGSRGQLGSEFQALSASAGTNRYYFYDLPELDITDRDGVARLCRECSVDVIVNCAAYTAVDRAESDGEAAMRVNRDGPAVLALCAKERGALLVHLSTDYVFNGESSRPYTETDPASPIGIYGLSKWEGEERVRSSGASYLIIRTSWLYSVYGSNFVKTMLRLGAEKGEAKVVFDQAGTPTWAADLAMALVEIIGRHDPKRIYKETFHYSNEGVCSWYDVAVAVMEMASLSCRVLPVESSEYPSAVKRPHYSVLNKRAVREAWGLEIPHWRTSLATMLVAMREKES